MVGLPVTIRLLDPPLHEFLPTDEKQLEHLSMVMGVPVRQARAAHEDLHEFNPMLGHRGCRLAITYPEIYEMQVRAILEAARSSGRREARGACTPEIMIPLAMTREELEAHARDRRRRGGRRSSPRRATRPLHASAR